MGARGGGGAAGRASDAGWAVPAAPPTNSTALVCFGAQEGAEFGYCGKGRNRRRHHPLVASAAETRAVVHSSHRDGSSIDEEEAMAFMREAVARVRKRVGGAISIRADAGFWSKAMGTSLLEAGIPFTFAMPLYSALKPLTGSAARPDRLGTTSRATTGGRDDAGPGAEPCAARRGTGVLGAVGDVAALGEARRRG